MPEPTPEVWAQIRYDYEHTERPLAHICAEHEITIPMLRYRMKRWDWTRRKPLVPRHGPPAVALTPVHPTPTVFAAIDRSSALQAPLHPTPTGFADAQPADSPPPGEGEEGQEAIVPRLQSAVARVLPAIEATIARLAAGAHHPREMEQAGRTLSSLTRTLRELNTLLGQHNARAEYDDDDDMPEDLDAFRIRLAERIEKFLASRSDEDWEANAEKT